MAAQCTDVYYDAYGKAECMRPEGHDGLHSSGSREVAWATKDVYEGRIYAVDTSEPAPAPWHPAFGDGLASKYPAKPIEPIWPIDERPYDPESIQAKERRERIATAAMQGILARGVPEHWNEQVVTDMAVSHADTLIALLDRTK